MARAKVLLTAALLPALLLALPSAARAGHLLDWLCHRDCPPPSYSPARYWAPEASRVYDCVCGPKISVYPPDRHPEVPATYVIARYPCPPVAPADLWDGNSNVPRRQTGPTVGQSTATAAAGAASSADSASKSAGLTK